MTELEAVNRMLGWVGEQAATALDSSVSPWTRAQTTLDNHSRRIQSMGLHCNTRYDVTYTADGSGNYVLASTILRADPSDPSVNYVQRGTTMYDPEEGTDVFTVGATVDLDIIEELTWTDLPEVVQEYIVTSAIREFIMAEVGDIQLYQIATQDYREARLAWAQAEASTSDANMLRDSHTVSAAANRVFNP